MSSRNRARAVTVSTRHAHHNYGSACIQLAISVLMERVCAGCITCKAKRLKCGEEKPGCQQCARRKVDCGGYKKDFKWRPFEETNVKQHVERQRRGTSRHLPPRRGVDVTVLTAYRQLTQTDFCDRIRCILETAFTRHHSSTARFSSGSVSRRRWTTQAR